MTPATRTLITRLERLGHTVLAYHRGRLYLADLGVRDTAWAIHVIRRAGEDPRDQVGNRQ